MNNFMMKPAQELQAKLAKAETEISNTVVEARRGGGAVKDRVMGSQNIR